MGLSEDQKKLITSSWATLAPNPDTIQTNGAILFGLLFKTYKDTRGFFKHIDPSIPDDGLKSTGVGRAHAMAVFTGLGAIVDCINDEDCLMCLALKLARNHLDRKVGPNRFKQLRDVFPGFLDDATGKTASADVHKAWDALLSFLQDVLAAEEKKR